MRLRNDTRSRANLYYTATIVVSGLALLTSWEQHPISHLGTAFMLGALALFADYFAFSLPVSGSVSLAFAMSYAGLLYDGPIAAVVVALLGSISIRDIRNNKPPLQMAFDSAQLVLSMLVSGLLYVTFGGVPLSQSAHGGVVASLLPALLSASAFFGLNIVLVGMAVAIKSGMSIREVFREQHFGVYWVSLLVLALLGLILANLLRTSGWSSVLLLLVPFTVARQTFLAYRELEDAYAGTVRSLVAAIEAKDPYTKGHSERVAEYARRIAHSLGLGASAVQRIEYAALLHDIGKIGMRTETLTKPGALTADEYREIQAHSAIGRDLISEVEALADIQGAVYSHHERVDGTGYPEGILGDDIPLDAKILAVADCFDAMTSDRPYREALGVDIARAEIAQVADHQLDADVVSAFLGLDDVIAGRAGDAT